MWKKELPVLLCDGTALWKSEQEQLTGRSHPPEAQKYKPVYALQTSNVLQLSQAGWLISKKATKCHLQRGQRHWFVTSKSLCAPSLTAQGTSVLQPQALGLVHALLAPPWNAAARLKKEDSDRCFWEHFCKLKGWKNHMHCHIYGIGLESTFNMHSNTHQSFLKVQLHLLSGKREMQVRLSPEDLSVCERAACLVYQPCWSRVTPAVTALHWPLVHRQKLTSASGGRECGGRVGKGSP